MRNLRVDFAPPSRLVPALCCALSLLLFPLAAHQAWQAVQIRRERLAIEARLPAVRSAANTAEGAAAGRSDAEATAVPAAVPPAYYADAAAMAHAAAFDMDKVLRAVEGARVPGVKVLAMALDADKHSAQIEIEFDQAPEALARYLKALNGSDGAGGPWRLVHADFPPRVKPTALDASLQATPGLMGSATVAYREP